ncbi:MAG: FAD-dependent oxidoreductase, partial [bacterium]
MIRTARSITGNLTEKCQVCVIGSGAGGAVVAAELAEAGYDVLILEEGGYHRTTTFSHDPLRMLPKLYRNAGGDSTFGNPPIMFAEGRCVGGSTVINGGICYRTPEKVLHVWSLALGTLQLLPEAMGYYFDRVEKQLHVTDVPDEIIGEDGRRMRLAAERLGYHYSRVKRNIYACQGTNQCIMGCPTGAKQSTLVTYIPRARQAGARIIANCKAQKLLLNGDRVTGVSSQIVDPITGKALHDVNISAETVFLAAGALQTPALLYRSKIADKLKSVGKTLFMHPNTKCIGVFDEEIHGWQGSIQGFQID